MIPPILEIFVLWHPDDVCGETVAATLFEHFHGTSYSGLIGGAVEVYVRSSAWDQPGGPPRTMPFMEPLPHDLPSPAIAVVVPVLGTHLARAVTASDGWHAYLEEMTNAAAMDESVGIFPLRLDSAATDETTLASIFPGQALAGASLSAPRTLCRELAQSVAQLVGDPFGDRLQIFISHTKRHSPDEGPDQVDSLIAEVRKVVSSTHLASFFDEADIQPGEDWDRKLKLEAANSGLLMVRTDLYASRDWCQQEVLAAKRAEMPIVTLLALSRGEERGSFLLDHVPTVLLDPSDGDSRSLSIEAALNQLVDEALKRALWNCQRAQLASAGFDWLPVHAPEPTTVLPWILERHRRGLVDEHVFVLHPDPPLGTAEAAVIEELFLGAGMGEKVDIVTPRSFASRSGSIGDGRS